MTEADLFDRRAIRCDTLNHYSRPAARSAFTERWEFRGCRAAGMKAPRSSFPANRSKAMSVN